MTVIREKIEEKELKFLNRADANLREKLRNFYRILWIETRICENGHHFSDIIFRT